jgi:hypothetical protein
MSYKKILSISLLCTLLQVLLVTAVARHVSGGGSIYEKLCNWDGSWYWHIVNDGYVSSIPPVKDNVRVSNVGFFPGYPAWSWLVMKLTRLSLTVSLGVAAQIACWIFWFYCVALLDRWKVPSWMKVWVILAILVHPAAFYMACSYSESLFLALALGFLYWLEKQGAVAGVLAAAHGFFMTATRLVGIPLPLLSPMVPAVNSRGWKPRLWIAALGCAGTIAFFIYCQLRFGHWDLYFQSKRIGWDAVPHYGAAFSPWNYIEPFSRVSRLIHLEPDSLSRISLPIFLIELLIVIFCEWKFRDKSSNRVRLYLYSCSVALFYVSVTSMASRDMQGMVRLVFPSHVLLSLGFVQLLSGHQITPRVRKVLVVCGVVLALASAALQISLAKMFLSGQWVA